MSARVGSRNGTGQAQSGVPPSLRARCLRGLSQLAEHYLRSQLFLICIRPGMKVLTTAQTLQMRALDHALPEWAFAPHLNRFSRSFRR